MFEERQPKATSDKLELPNVIYYQHQHVFPHVRHIRSELTNIDYKTGECS